MTTVFQSTQVTAGIGKETTYGVGVSPTNYFPWLALDPDDINTVLADSAWRGAPADAYGYTTGATAGSVPFGGNIHPDTVGFPLAGILGDVASSGTNPTTWTMAALNTGTQQPPSYTVTTTDGVNSRRWAGLKFSTVTLSADAQGALEWTGEAQSLISSTTSGPTTSYSTVKIQPGWIGAHQIGGSNVTSMLSCDVQITRQVDAKRNNDGSQAPYLQRSGVLTVAGSLVLVLQTDTYRSQYVAGTSTSLNLNWAQGAGATATQLQIHCSSITWKNVQPDYTSGAFQQVKLDFAAAYNSADVGASGGASPCKVTLKNQVSAGTYA